MISPSYQLFLRSDHFETPEALELEGGVVVAVVVERIVRVTFEPSVALAALDHLWRELHLARNFNLLNLRKVERNY